MDAYPGAVKWWTGRDSVQATDPRLDIVVESAEMVVGEITKSGARSAEIPKRHEIIEFPGTPNIDAIVVTQETTPFLKPVARKTERGDLLRAKLVTDDR